VHPILFRIGNFYLATYGLMIALGLSLGILVALNRGKRVQIPTSAILDLVFYSVIGGVVGGRLLHVIVYFDEFLKSPLEVAFSRAGFVFLGSVIGAVAVAAYIIRRERLDFWKVMDVLITALPLGHVFGRIGCFLAGCCYGRPLDPSGPLGFLGVRFPKGIEIAGDVIGGQAWDEHVEAGLLPSTADFSLPVIPTQLIESGANLIIFALLMFFWSRRKFHGQIFLTYLVLYGVERFLVEFLRGDTGRGFFLGLSTSQLITLIGIVFAGAFWSTLKRFKPVGNETPVVAPAAAASASQATPDISNSSRVNNKKKNRKNG
jgi:phosphatidylglycerol:prolipoprotein diacylglycerol transferase